MLRRVVCGRVAVVVCLRYERGVLRGVGIRVGYLVCIKSELMQVSDEWLDFVE